MAIRPKEPDFNADYVFERLQNGLAQGRCLITVATGELSDVEGERTGLVATHAYAVLDLKEIDVSDSLFVMFSNFIKVAFLGRKTFAIEKSMVTSSLEGQLFRIGCGSLDDKTSRSTWIRSKTCCSGGQRCFLD